MKFLSKINWLQRASELLVIVLGILVAFSLESWWSSRTDAKREKVYLTQLRMDFEDIRDDLDYLCKGEKQLQDNLKAISDLLKSPPSEENAGRLAELLPGINTFGRFAPKTGTYGALIHSGDIKLLQSQKLRRALVSFAAGWDFSTGELQRQGDWVYQTISKPVATKFLRAELMVRDPGSPPPPTEEFEAKIDHLALLSEPEFNKYIVDLWIGCSWRRGTFVELKTRAEAVLAEL